MQEKRSFEGKLGKSSGLGTRLLSPMIFEVTAEKCYMGPSLKNGQ